MHDRGLPVTDLYPVVSPSPIPLWQQVVAPSGSVSPLQNGTSGSNVTTEVTTHHCSGVACHLTDGAWRDINVKNIAVNETNVTAFSLAAGELVDEFML